MTTKAKRKLLSELKQLKIRQKCIEKGITWPIKLSELEDEELAFLRAVEKLKTENDKNHQIGTEDAKAIARNCFSRVHQFQKVVLSCDENVVASRPTELLQKMAEINLLLSENLFICHKELSSLKYQSEQLSMIAKEK